MKQLFYFLALWFLSINALAQKTPQVGPITIEDLVATVQDNNLQISWLSNKVEGNYWEVQASANGTSFSTIGLVMGADPKATKGLFCFKQHSNKMKPGLRYFRVLYIETPGDGIASNSIRLTK